MQQITSRNFLILTTGFSFLIAAGCGQKPGGMPEGFAVSVVATPAVREKIEDKISLVGTLAANEAVEIKNETAGMIEEIGFIEGETVKQGQMLFMLDADKLNASAAQAEANLELAKTTFDRLSSLITSGAVSQQEYDQAKADLDARKAEVDLIRAELKETVISAAFSGVVGERKVSIGQYVDQGTSLSFLINQDPMKAEFRIPERYVGQLNESQTIELTVAAYPDQTFKGEVYFIDPQIDEQARTALVKAKVANPDGKLRRGMFANLDLIVSVKPNALVVPETALIPRGDEVYVFIIDGESKAQMKAVKVGVRLSGKVEILEGLSENDSVIIEGYQKIGPGSPVNAKKQTEEIPAAQ